MQPLRIYTSASSAKLANLGLDRIGRRVELLPLSELPHRPAIRPASLRAELADIHEELISLGLRLDEHLLGCRRLSAEVEQDLQAHAAALRQRRQHIQVQLQEGGQGNA